MIVNDKIYFHTKDQENNVIINGINGAVDIINKDVAEGLDTLELKKIDESVIEQLMERGYVFRNENEKKSLEQEVYDVYMESLKEQPIEFTILPTTDCNLKCTYCFQGHDKEQLVMDDEKLNTVFECIKTMKSKENAKAAISLFGGEPLMQKNYSTVKKIFDFAENDNIEHISITTNGVDLHHYLDLFSEKIELISCIGITLDGPESVHERLRVSKNGEPTFNKILDNIEKVLEMGIDVFVRVNVDHNNVNYVRELISILDKRFSLFTEFSCYLALVTHKMKKGENDVSLSDLSKLVTELSNEYSFITTAGLGVIQHVLAAFKGQEQVLMPRFGYCEATDGKHYAFSPDGYIYSCNELIGNREHAIGVFEPELKIFNSEVQKWKENSVLNRDSCKKCAISLICGGGCRIQNISNETYDRNLCSQAKSYGELNNFITYIKQVYQL